MANPKKMIETAKSYAAGAVAVLSQPATFRGDALQAAQWLEDAARMLRESVREADIREIQHRTDLDHATASIVLARREG